MTEGSHVWMWELNHKEAWAPTNWYFLIVVLKNTLESSLDSKEIKLAYLKGNQPWIFIGRTDAETKAPRLWPPGVKSLHIGKDSDAGKDWKQKEKWEAEDKMVREHHQLNGQEFEQSPGDSEGQGSLVCCSPWSRKEKDMTERMNNNKLHQEVKWEKNQSIGSGKIFDKLKTNLWLYSKNERDNWTADVSVYRSCLVSGDSDHTSIDLDR